MRPGRRVRANSSPARLAVDLNVDPRLSPRFDSPCLRRTTSPGQRPTNTRTHAPQISLLTTRNDSLRPADAPKPPPLHLPSCSPPQTHAHQNLANRNTSLHSLLEQTPLRPLKTMAAFRSVPLVCSGHQRPVVHLNVSVPVHVSTRCQLRLAADRSGHVVSGTLSVLSTPAER